MKGIILYYSIRAAEYFLVFKFLAVHRKKQTNARSQKKQVSKNCKCENEIYFICLFHAKSTVGISVTTD